MIPYTGPASSQLFPVAVAGLDEAIQALGDFYPPDPEVTGPEPETAAQGRYNLLSRRRRRWTRLQARS